RAAVLIDHAHGEDAGTEHHQSTSKEAKHGPPTIMVSGGGKEHSAPENPMNAASWNQASRSHGEQAVNRSVTIERLASRHGRACPGHPRLAWTRKTLMPATSAGMTRRNLGPARLGAAGGRRRDRIVRPGVARIAALHL